jgi:hypothetical protein
MKEVTHGGSANGIPRKLEVRRPLALPVTVTPSSCTVGASARWERGEAPTDLRANAENTIADTSCIITWAIGLEESGTSIRTRRAEKSNITPTYRRDASRLAWRS